MTRHPRPAVFLDRDGVLNETVVRDGKPYPPRSAAEVRVLAGVPDACRRLHELGFTLVVVTNQPDIARGTTTAAEVERIHDRLRSEIWLDDIVVCAHDDADRCRCRKPEPGMLLDAAERLDLDLARSFCVGDRWRDIEAARRAGVRGIHVDYDYDEKKATDPVAVVTSLRGAVTVIEALQNEGAQR